MYSRVLGTGSALPKRIVTNGEFAAMLARDGIETSDEWIRTRTGIESRHFADEAEGETTSSLAVAAARRALEAANVETSEIVDLFDSRPVAWAIGARPTAALANESLSRACAC